MITVAIIRIFQKEVQFWKALDESFPKNQYKSKISYGHLFDKISIYISKYSQMVITSSILDQFQKKSDPKA